MNHDDFSFEGLEEACVCLRRCAREAAYVVLTDRTDSQDEDNVGRFDFTEAQARPFLSSSVFEDVFAMPRAEAPPPELDEVGLSAGDIAEAACRWLEQTAMQNSLGESWRRFRIRIYGPKGYSKLDSARFVVRWRPEEPEPTALDTPRLHVTAPSPEEAESVATVRGITSLGAAYAQFAQLLLGTMREFQGMSMSNQSQLNRQLASSRDQVEGLVDSVLATRAHEALSTRQSQHSAQDDAMRSELARAAVEQIGQTAQAVMMAQGLPPETKELLGVLGSSPELRATLQDPTVQALMQNPENLSALSTLLRQAAAQANAVGTPPASPPAPPPPPQAWPAPASPVAPPARPSVAPVPPPAAPLSPTQATPARPASPSRAGAPYMPPRPSTRSALQPGVSAPEASVAGPSTGPPRRGR